MLIDHLHMLFEEISVQIYGTFLNEIIIIYHILSALNS